MPGSLGSGHSTKTVLPSGILMRDFGAATTANSTGSTIVGVDASKHSTSTSRIVAGETDTRGAASTMAPVAGSSAGLRRTG
jgi:hypothetical protein